MNTHINHLWSLQIETTKKLLPFLESFFEERALSLSSLIQPRKKIVRLDVLLDSKPNLHALQPRLSLLAYKAEQPLPTLVLEKIPQIDWVEKVAHDFPPLQIGRWTVFTKSHSGEIGPTIKHPLQIEATSAFGTGEHPTTYGCLFLLDSLLKRSRAAYHWKMLDIGSGSGILSMAFSGASKGHAIGGDIDKPSLKIAHKNLHINKMKSRIRFFPANGYKHPVIGKNAPYDLIMANIFAGPLCAMAPDLWAHLKPGGTAILSGILQNQERKVIARHQNHGLVLRKKIHVGEWSILELAKPYRAQ